MDRFKIYDGNFQLEFPARGKNSFLLLKDEKVIMALGRIQCGKFSEVGALEEKFRIHPNQDSFSADIESTNVIPFGCEYEVSRTMHTASGFIRATSDIRAVNFGRVGNLALEDARFSSDFAKLEYLIYGEDSMRRIEGDFSGTDIYRGTEPVVMMTMTLKDGCRIDFGCGSDIWRLRSAKNIADAECEFFITKVEDEIICGRKPLIYREDAVIEQRPWRFKSIISWHDGNCSETTSAEDAEKFSTSGCLLSAVSRRDFRRKIRRASGNLICSGCAPQICHDPSHLEKPDKKELCHFDLE